MIRGEISGIIQEGANIPQSYCMKQRGETDTRIFKNLVREAAERYFKGQCKNDATGIKGECEPDRLIVNTLGSVESFYNRSTPIDGFEDWESTAKTMLSRQSIYGYRCQGVNDAPHNTPIIWGNTPSKRFPNDPPVVGQENVLDWIDHKEGSYKYFVIQSSGDCPKANSCDSTASGFNPFTNVSVLTGINLTCLTI